MDDTVLIQKQNSRKVVVSKGSRNLCSKCCDAIFHTTFVVCVSAAKYVAPPLFILPGKRLNGSVTEGCNIEGDKIITAPKGFINSTSFLIWLEFFADSVADSVARPLVLVYYGCCSHNNYEIVKKSVELKFILILLPDNSTGYSCF